MRLIGYARVSDKEQLKTGYSIEAQEEALRDWAAINSHHLTRIFVETGRSATKASQTTRPTFEQAVAIVLAGAADGLIVRWMDRFARNVEDFLRVRSQLYQAGKHLISISEPLLNGDPGDPVARYISVAIMNAYQLQAELSGLKAAQGRDRRARQGHYPGSLPLGYKRIANTIEVDGDHAPAIIAAFNEFAGARHTLDTWTQEAAHRGYRTRRGNKIAKSVWHKILRNPFYTGRYTWKGQDYQGPHPPLVGEAQFQTVQDLLDAAGLAGGQRRHDWLLAGLLWSVPLAKMMTGILVKDRFAYYRAVTPGQPEHTVPAGHLEQRVEAHLAHIRWTGERYYTIPEEWRLAIKVSDLRSIFQHLETKKEKKDYLRMIFLKRGIHIDGQAIVKVDLFLHFIET